MTSKSAGKRDWLRPRLDAALRVLLACLLTAHWAISADPAALRSTKAVTSAEAAKILPQAPRDVSWVSAGKFGFKSAERQTWSGDDALAPAAIQISQESGGAALGLSRGFAVPPGQIRPFQSRAPPHAA